ncbi:MAG TPA: sialidase family protein, partial [Thermoanaerobaculia bacterium]|nr:sialidase family protein [Thermoanaerobaculia bacterium]
VAQVAADGHAHAHRPPPSAAADHPAAPGEVRFPGRDAALAWAGGALHAVYVDEGGERGPRVLHRRLDAQPSAAHVVSPAGEVTTAHGESALALAALPDGTLVAAYPARRPGKWQGVLLVQRSTDGGVTWSAPRPLHDDGRDGGAHNFLDAVATPEGEVVFAWLDDRSGRQGLRLAATADGATMAANRTVDPATCECCRTALLAGAGGRLWLAWRDSEAGVRDVALARSRDGGRRFAPAVAVSQDGWEIDGCPHSGPRLARAADGALWTTWMTGADPAPGLYAAVSRDDGATFSPRQEIARSTPGGAHASHPEIAVLPDGRVAVLYETTGERRHELRMRTAEAENGWSAPATLAADATYPRWSARPDAETGALVFTRHGGEGGSEVVVRRWPDLGPGR